MTGCVLQHVKLCRIYIFCVFWIPYNEKKNNVNELQKKNQSEYKFLKFVITNNNNSFHTYNIHNLYNIYWSWWFRRNNYLLRLKWYNFECCNRQFKLTARNNLLAWNLCKCCKESKMCREEARKKTVHFP